MTPEQRQTLRALVERILPGAEGPGAAEAGVIVAVERAMEHRVLRGLRRGIVQLLDGLEMQAQEHCGQTFAGCGAETQDELMRGVERDANHWMRFIMRTLVGLSVEGLLGDPLHGGNRDGRGWSALALDAADVRSGFCRGERRA